MVVKARPAPIGGENARRNPQRTASTAAALMIGLALVTLVATLAAGIIASFEGSVNDLWKTSDSDYGITAQNNFSPIPVDAANAAAQAPGVEAVMKCAPARCSRSASRSSQRRSIRPAAS